MKVAVVGSRGLMPSDEEMAEHLSGAGEIVSGGAAGVDTCAAAYAARHGLTLTEFLPDYARYGRAAPIVRNREIVDHADRVVVFWDGSSKGRCRSFATPRRWASRVRWCARRRMTVER